MSGEEVLGVLYVSLWTLAKPDDFTLAPELLNDLLPVWWGERAQINSTDLNEAEVFGSEAGWRTKLESLEQDGQICAAKDKIIDAAKNQRIEFFVWREGGEKPQPLSFALWHTTEFSLLDNSIHFGAVRLDDNGLVPDEKGKSLILRKEDANDWLNEIRSPHVLPDPLKRNDDTLPEGETVSLCELVTWLIDGKALQIDETKAQSKARKAEFTALLESRASAKIKPPWPLIEAWPLSDRRALARLVAEELAREVRVRDVNVAIVKTMLRGEIRGYADGASGSGQREAIPSQELPETLPSNFVIDGNRLSVRMTKSAKWTHWKNVGFERDDLLRLWGDDAQGKPPESAESAIDESKGGASSSTSRFRKTVEAVYQQRVEEWPENVRHPTRDEDVKWMMDKFGVKRPRAREIRNLYALDSWKKDGAPKSPAREPGRK